MMADTYKDEGVIRPSRTLGPGLLVAAAFVGPGTVATATLAGSGFGFALCWALLFSVVATIVLQEMAARLGLVTRQGLGEAVRGMFSHRLVRTGVILLVVLAIAVGNAAFEMGNITGAAMGLETLTGVSRSSWSLVLGVAAIGLLALGTYKTLERILVALVCLMGLAFLATAVMIRPNLEALVEGLFIPTLPPASTGTVIAIIGTTIVPYNLFLHARIVAHKWPASIAVGDALRASRWDTVVSICLGGLITLAIIATAATFYGRGTNIESAVAMAQQLRPLLGSYAEVLFACGIFAAGITSAITAPLAAAFATAGALGWSEQHRPAAFRAVWATVVVAGTLFAYREQRPVAGILIAQVANGLLLPVIAILLLMAMNRSNSLGRHTNGLFANVAGVAVIIVAAGLGAWRLVTQFGLAPA